MKFLLIGLKKRISEEKTLKEITPIYINREMDEKDVKKIKAFVKKNSYPPYEIIKDSMLHKAQQWKNKGDMELKFHYLMMNSEYRYENHKYLQEIYENIDDVELIKKNGDEIDKLGGIQTMEYNAFAFCEVLTYLVNTYGKTKFEQNELYYKMKRQLQTSWDGVGTWKFTH